MEWSGININESVRINEDRRRLHIVLLSAKPRTALDNTVALWRPLANVIVKKVQFLAVIRGPISFIHSFIHSFIQTLI